MCVTEGGTHASSVNIYPNPNCRRVKLPSGDGGWVRKRDRVRVRADLNRVVHDQRSSRNRWLLERHRAIRIWDLVQKLVRTLANLKTPRFARRLAKRGHFLSLRLRYELPK